MKLVKKIRDDDLLKGSFILIIMFGFFNILNYLFHFSMARFLGPSGYGVLAVLMSLIYIFSIPSESIQNIITNYTSRFNSKNEEGKIKFLLFKSLKKGFLFSFIIFLFFIPLAFFLSFFLKISFFLFIYLGLIIFMIFSLPILRGILQGTKRFVYLGIDMIIEGTIKIIFAIIFVLIGFKVYGAVSGILFGAIFAFLLGFLFIKDILNSKKIKEDFSGIYNYSVPFFISILAITLMYSLDMLLAKRFFSPDLAGKYAVASMLGKIIFFGTFAISKAMFPLTSENPSNKKNTKMILKKSIKIILIFSIPILILFFLYPSFLIEIFFSSQYIQVSNILFLVSLSFTFLSFSNIFILYSLSINKLKKSYFLLSFPIFLTILFFFFHKSLVQFSISFVFSNFLMFICSLVMLKNNKG